MILLTGANGLLGSFVLKKLLEDNYSVRILLRSASNTRFIATLLHKVEVVYGDITDIPSLEEAVKNCDTVIHAAAIISFGDVKHETLMKTNVEGTKNVVNVCLKHAVKRLIHISSIAAIGRSSNQHSITEDTKWVNDPNNSVYAVSKYLAEQEIWRGICEGLSAVILCPSVVLGPSDWNRGSTRIFKNIYNGMFFYPSGSVNLVDVRDVADIVAQAIHTPHINKRYIVNGGTLSYYSFFEAIAKGFRKTPPRWLLKEQWVLPAYYILKWLWPSYLKSRSINRETIRVTSRNFIYDNSLLLRDFGFSYRNIMQSIAWTCEELKQIYSKHG